MNAPRYLYFNSRDEFFRVEVDKIAYFEGDGNYTSFVLTNGQKGSVLLNLAQMQAVLSDNLHEDAKMFARVGKRFIVNMRYIYRIEIQRQRLTVTDGDRFAFQLPVSKEALKALRDICIGKPVK